MRLVPDPALDADYPRQYTSEVEIRTRDGRTLARRVEHARGTPENPLTPDEIRAKYLALTSGTVPRARAEAIMTLVERVDRAADLTGLTDRLRARSGRRRRTTPRRW